MFGKNKNKLKIREQNEAIAALKQNLLSKQNVQYELEKQLKSLEIYNRKTQEVVKELQEERKQKAEAILKLEEKLKFEENKEITTLLQRLKEQSDTIEILTNENVLLQDKIEMNTADVINNKNIIDLLKSELKNKNEKIEELENVSVRTKEIEIELEATKNHLENIEIDLKNKTLDMEDMNLEIANKTKTILRMQQNLKNKAQVIKLLNSDLESMKTEIMNCEKQLSSKDYDLKKTNEEILGFKSLVKKHSRNIQEYELEISNRACKIDELTLKIESSRNDLKEKQKLIQELELKIKGLEFENQNEKANFDAKLKLFQEELDHNNDVIQTQYDQVKSLNNKLIEVEDLNTQTHVIMDQKDEMINEFEKMLNQKNTEIMSKNMALVDKSKELDMKVHEIEVLQFKMVDNNELHRKELEHIKNAVQKQLKTIHNRYQFEMESREYEVAVFTKNLENQVCEQVKEQSFKLQTVDDMRKFLDVIFREIESKSDETDKIKRLLDALGKQQEELVANMKEELIKRNNVNKQQKKQLKENDIHIKRLQEELLSLKVKNINWTCEKSEDKRAMKDTDEYEESCQLVINFDQMDQCDDETRVGVPRHILASHGNDPTISFTDNKPTLVKKSQFEIYTRNVIIEQFREDLKAKEHEICSLREHNDITEKKYIKLVEKINRVVVTLRRAKHAYQELEKETKRMRNEFRSNIGALNFSQENGSNVDESCINQNVEDLKKCDLESETQVIAPKLQSLCTELALVRQEYSQQKSELQRRIGYLMSQLQKEKKLRRKTESSFKNMMKDLMRTPQFMDGGKSDQPNDQEKSSP